ncbi:MAG: hypothetical protein CM15mL1_2010 [Libanvirus sp.]|jgi:hypothetical protein|nr:MAG: hypothetical protein CM15mL1_2010 [Libanvirus sp.]|tara:strand:+ start:694 stop:915 length:222 start_codon:yes stop_codon:yes gene_type:complete
MTTRKLTDQQFKDLKELYVDRIVDNMSMKDLIIYATEDMQKWVDSLTYNDAMVEIEEYFDEYFTDTIEEVING